MQNTCGGRATLLVFYNHQNIIQIRKIRFQVQYQRVMTPHLLCMVFNFGAGRGSNLL